MTVVYDQDHGRIYLILEYCRGGDLHAYLQRHKRVSETVAKHFIRQLGKWFISPLLPLSSLFHNSSLFSAASGLQMLRDNNVVHRDLKPQVLYLISSFNFPQLLVKGSRMICWSNLSNLLDSEFRGFPNRTFFLLKTMKILCWRLPTLDLQSELFMFHFFHFLDEKNVSRYFTDVLNFQVYLQLSCIYLLLWLSLGSGCNGHIISTTDILNKWPSTLSHFPFFILESTWYQFVFYCSLEFFLGAISFLRP